MKKAVWGVLFALVLALVLSLIFTLPVAANGGNTYYVATTGSDTFGDGTETWVDNDLSGDWSAGDTGPWLTIGYALTQSISGDTINVAAGTYNEHINLVDGVQVLGAGAAITTIDGTNNGTVVTATNVGTGTTLDGFTIQNGSATNGAGMYNTNSSPVVSNCTFSANTASSGGGGMVNASGSSPTITNCTFSGNTATGKGGGMYNYQSSPTVTNCTFSGNTATTNNGGGMYNDDSSPTVTNCAFTGNTADDYGGGMYNRDSSSPTLTDCTFDDNTASVCGGGMYNTSSAAPTLTNCTFSANEATSGAGMYNSSASPELANCTFYGNTAGHSGGGMYNSYASPGLTNCTFYGNTAPVNGDGMYNISSAAPTLINCILWDGGDEISNSSSTPVVSYCDIQGGYPAGSNIIDEDPLFINPATGDFHLQGGSPCIDVGNNSAPDLPATDFEGDDRILNGVVDMGVDEYVPPPTEVWVDASWTCQADVDLFDPNLVWQYDAFATIQDGIDAVVGSTVYVAAGTYYEHINLVDGVQVLGAGVGVSYINGMGSGTVVTDTVVTADGVGPTTLLDGFSIYGGSSYNGGGMLNTNGSQAVVSNCEFYDNFAVGGGGGGMFNNESSPTVINCTFYDNEATQYGGGMYSYGGTPTVTNCTFHLNTSHELGGGIANLSSSPTVTNCVFYGNSASSDTLETHGGGVYNHFGTPKFINCTIYGNTAEYGGGMYNFYSAATVTNCTFYSNSVPEDGGGMYNYYSPAVVTNCILWMDTVDEIFNDNSTPVVTYCDVYNAVPETVYPGTGNINDNPDFAAPGTGDFHLQSGSPCIDVGNNGAPFILALDFEWQPRIWNGTVDMGVDEYLPPPTEVWVDDDWAGTPPGTDLGGGKFFGYNAFAVIQDGIDAVSGSIVNVAAGTYYENITLEDGVQVVGAGAGSTTINGGGNDSVVTAINVGDTTALSGFNITNGSATNGGGMYNNNASPTVTGCTFTGNTAISGGGMANQNNSSPALTGCAFTTNAASDGGGMYNGNNSSPTLDTCTFTGNSADYGGGMANIDNCTPILDTCTFTSNSAGTCGGGMYNFYYCSPQLTGCDFTSNTTAVGDGGGMYNDNNSSPILTTCTFTGNSAVDGGGMYNDNNSSPILDTCTFTSNSAGTCGGGMYNLYYCSPILTTCTFTGNSATVIGGGMFSNDYCSPQLTGCDFTSNTATVDGGGMANYNDSSPTLDTCTFEGNTAASDGGGIYNAGNCSPQLTGCDFTSNTATVGGGGMNNFDHSSPILTTCTFTSNDAGFAGGGMCSNSYCSPQLTGCTFTSNTADVNGGGMGNFNDSSPILTTCTFTTNSADYDGGGISNYNSLLTFTDCTFSGNSTTIGDGGGMYNQSCSATSAITGCTFNGNTAASDGGGIFSYDTDLEVTGCTFTGNTADVSGGGMYNYHYSSPTVTNCTFSSNTADFYGGGIYNAGNCSPQLTNCILWGDTPDEICNDDVDSVPVVTYCDVQGGYGDPADNNINANPQFVNAGTGDFHLLGGSPCIDVGDNAAVPGGLTTDIDGQPRILNGVVDMGIDECLAQVWVDNHWAGTTPGEEVNGYIFGLNAFAVIQDGIDAVVAGGTVNVYPGDGAYVEPPIVISKSLTLQSVSGDWHDTTIDDCLDAEIVIRDITSPFSGDAVISGFTISGGYYGIAIPEGLTADGSVTVSNCLIYENTNTGIYAGGELYGDIFIDECIIGENGSTAGIHLASIAGTVEITNSVIGAYWDGYMVSWGNAGNGIQLDSIYETGTVLIDNCKITDNGGHGITDFISGCYGQLTITNNIIGTYYYDLTSGEGEVGGNTESGIYIDHVGATGVVTIEGNRIAQNYYGIEFAGTATIDGEVIINNNYIGAWTQSDGSNYNQYHGNHERGISVENVSTLGTLIITNNLIADNAYSGPKTGISLPLEGGVFITTTSGATVISANIIGAWTEDVAGVGPITYGGNGGPGIMVGEVAGGSLLIIGNTLAENFDTTLTGIHIDLAADTAEVNVHLNNILNNDGDGLYYNDGGVGYLNVIDAENNWWGDASGPGTVGLGTGDEVSDNVDYTPWLGVSVDNALAGTLNDSTLDATTANNTQVIVDGNATVITAQYSGDPGTGGFGGATGQYIDVYVDDPTGVTELEIRLYYTDADIASLIETSLKLSWWDGTSWLVCSDSGVNTDDIPPYSGYIWALIRTDTTPTLAQLTGSVFGGGGTPMLSPIGTGDTTGPIISEVATNCYGGVTETTADICWITNEPATSQVEYEASPGMLSPIDTNLVTTHHIQLTGLTPGTTYHYRTMSRDAYFNLTVSEWFTFTTLGGVTPAAAFTSSDLIISPAEVASGETVAIGVLVTNTGDLAGSYQVTLEINGVAEETIEVTLDAGAGEVVSFTVSRDEAGSYSVLVDGLSGSFSVTEPDTSQPTSPATTEEEPTSNIWPIVGGVIAAVVVIGLAVFVIRRRFA